MKKHHCHCKGNDETTITTKETTVTTAENTVTVTDVKTKPTWKTSFMVFVYAAVVGLCLIIQTVLNLLPTLVEGEIIKSNFWIGILNSELQMPIEVLAFIWVTMVSAYVGVDRGLYAARSFTLSCGETDVGDSHTLRLIILVSGLVFLEAVICNAVCKGEYALTEFASGFGMSCCLYVAGQKVIKAGKSVEGSHDKSELHPTEDTQAVTEEPTSETADSSETPEVTTEEVPV